MIEGRALWASVRALEESSFLAQRMAATSTGDMHARFLEKQETLMREANLIRDILLGAKVLPLEHVST